jgi:hypothetical protein
LRLEVKAFASLPLNLVRADPAAAAVVLVGELGPAATSRLRQEISTVLAKQGIDALQRELAQRGLAQQDPGLARYLGVACESVVEDSSNSKGGPGGADDSMSMLRPEGERSDY